MLYRALCKQARKRPNKAAVIGEREKLSYAQLLRQVNRAALYLRDCRLGVGDRLIVGIPPCPDFYILFYAATALGIATVPVSVTGHLAERAKALGAVAAAGDQRFLAKVRRSGLTIRQALVWDRKAGLLLPRTSQQFVRRKVIRKEPALGSFTSGTTGEPELFLRTVEVLMKRAQLGARAWSIRADDVLLSTGPFTSGAAAIYHLIVPILVGASVVVLEQFDRGKAVAAIAANAVTRIHAVPLIFDILARLPLDDRADFSSLKHCASAGAHLPRSIYDAFYKKFTIRIAQSYGGTDFALAFSVNRAGIPDAAGHRDGLFPVRVVGKNGKPVRNGAIGEIVFDIPRVKDRTARAALQKNPKRRGRYIFTGDLGRFDRAGNLYVVGRQSSMIKVGANRVIPAEVESVLRAHPKVKEAVVMPLRAGKPDEAVGAIVVRNGQVSAETLLDHCARHLESYKCPWEIVFRKNLVRNPHGKVVRHLFNAR